MLEESFVEAPQGAVIDVFDTGIGVAQAGVAEPVGQAAVVALTWMMSPVSLTKRWPGRLFSFISQNWRARPLVSYRVIVQLIAATTTTTGLNVHCELDPNAYPKGIKVSDEEMAAINLTRTDFLGDWNYTIAPQRSPNDAVIV